MTSRPSALAGRPALCFACSLALGLLCAHWLHGRLPAWWPLPLLLAGGGLLALLSRPGCRRIALIGLLSLFALALGASLYRLHAPDVPLPPSGALLVSGTVARAEPLEGGGADYLLADVSLRGADGAVHSLPGHTLARGARLPALAMPGQRLALAGASVQVPRGPRNPGGFNARLYSLTQGYQYVAYAGEAAIARGEGRPLSSAFLRARLWALDSVDALWPGGEENPIVRALLLGDTQRLPEVERETYSRLGISHVLAVSGLHVGFVVLLLNALMTLPLLLLPGRFAYLHGKLRALRAALVVLGAIAYGVLTGFSPSTFRAVVMAATLLASRACAARSDGLASVGVAAAIVLLARPMDLFSLSFALSFSAVLGMVLLSGPLRALLLRARLPGYLASALSATASAQLGTLPLVARAYNRIPLLGLLANLFAVPLAGAIVFLGLPSLLLYALLPWAASALAHPVALLARLLSRLANAMALMPAVSADVASPPASVVVLFWAGLLLLAPEVRAALGRLRPMAYAAVGASVLIALVAWGATLWPSLPVLTMLDVGQGHASIVRQGRVALLFDAGNHPAPLDAAAHYGLVYDALFLSHGDLDHAGALCALVEEGKVESLYLPAGIDASQGALADALAAAQRLGVPVSTVRAGDHVDVGPLRVVLHAPLEGRVQRGDNANMMVASLVFGGEAQVLFTGDLNMASEAGVALPRARVLQVAHHGSDGATSAPFLRVVAPQVAAIPVGTNAYGHPGEALLARLSAQGIEVERTDLSGAVEIRLGDELTVARWGRER